MRTEEHVALLKRLAQTSHCIHSQVAAIILNKSMVIGFGVNSRSSGGETNKDPCTTIGHCRKRLLGFGHAEGHGACLSTHAEVVAIANAFKNKNNLVNTEIFITHSPCSNCAKLIVESGIKKVTFIHNYGDTFTMDILRSSGITVRRYDEESGQKIKV